MGDPASRGGPRVEVTRFWCPPTETYSIDSDGFLSDPERVAFGGRSRNPNAVATEALAGHRCVVLLGEPGVGKSRTLAGFNPVAGDQINVVRIDLASYGTEPRLIRDVFERDEITRWRADGGSLALVLDSFDEAQRRVPTLPLIARDYLGEYPCDRLYLRIACRTAEWPTTLAQTLNDCFNSSMMTVELLPLRRKDVPRFLPDTVDADRFLAAIDEVHAGPLAARPLTLRMLIGSYLREGSLPSRGAALYERGMLTLCDEHSNERRDTSLASQLTPLERLVVAGRVAACTSFGARTTLSLAPAGTTEAHDLPVDDIVGGTEGYEMGAVRVDRPAMKETLETALFSGRGVHRIGWTHATFPDFLAARWLLSNEVTDEQIRSVMVAFDGRLFPQVRRIAAWLVAIRAERFAWLTTLDPESFLSEIDLPDETLRKRVVDALFQLAESGELQHEYGRNFQGLHHSELVDQVRPRLAAAADVQRLAIDIAEDCGLKEVLPALVDVAFDHAVVDYNRVAAAWAVHHLTEDDRGDALARLARDSTARGADPNDELKGAALLASWPHAIATAEAFSLVDPQHPRNLYGTHAMFVRTLAESLTAADLAAAVAWLRQLGDRIDDERMAPLVRGALLLALEQLDDPEARAAVVSVARRRAANYQSLFGEDGGEPDVTLSDDARRRLAMELLADSDDDLLIQMTESVGGHGLALVRPDDLPWLIETYAARDDLRSPLRRVVEWVVRLHDPVHVNLLLGLPREHPFFVDVVAPWVEPIRLDSPQATELREQWRLVTRRRAQRRPTEDDREVEQFIRTDLEAIRAGETDRFWHLARLVKVRPGSRYYNDDFQPDLTRSARWDDFSDDVRSTIVDAASRYVRSANCQPEKWLGTTTRYFPAEAGYQALLLLLRLRPDELTTLDGSVWREWAPILIDWTTTANGAAWEDKQILLTYARPHAHEELTETIITLVKAAAAEDAHVFLNQECELLWSERLASELLSVAAEMSAPTTFGDVLPLLAQLSPDLVRPLLLDWLRPESSATNHERGLLAGRLLLRHDAAATWDLLRARMLNDPDFGSELVLGYGHAHDRTPPDLAPKQLAELYLWLVERFPPSEDPTFEDVHWVGPREALGNWRDAILRHLRSLGTPDAVDAVRAIAAARPEIAWHGQTLIAAQDALRANLWHPLSPPELMRIASEPQSRLVYDEAALLRLVRSQFAEIQHRLQGQTPESHLLWDSVARRPKSEDEISDYLRNRLQDRLGDRGVVVNREVQVRRPRRTGIGERTDLHIDAVTDASSTGRPTITIVGEVKGAWNDETNTAMQSQLVDRYMRDVGSRHGVFVVAWFDPESWNEDDDRRRHVARDDPASLKQRLEQQAADLRARGIFVDVVILDCSYARPPTDAAEGSGAA